MTFMWPQYLWLLLAVPLLLTSPATPRLLPEGGHEVNEFLERFLTDTSGCEVLADLAKDWKTRRVDAIAEVAGPDTAVLQLVDVDVDAVPA